MRALPIVLIVVGIGLLGTAGYLWFTAERGYQQSKETYEKIDSFAKTEGVDGTGPALPTVDFQGLANINPDVVGWIYIPNSYVNYPVVKGTDNEHYLKTLFDGTPNPSGSIFMDMDDAAPGLQNGQTTIYGHHMRDGQMFNFVDKANQDQSVFDGIHTVYYITRDATYTLKPLFTARVAPNQTEVRTPDPQGGVPAYLQKLFSDAHSKASDVSQRMQAATKVVSLVTCNYDLDVKERSVLVCTLEGTYPAGSTQASSETASAASASAAVTGTNSAESSAVAEAGSGTAVSAKG